MLTKYFIMNLKQLLFSVSMLFLCFCSLAQTPIKVTGIVTAGTGNNPLPGVTVRLKGGKPQNSTQTGVDGRFTLTISAADVNPIIEFSYLGYLSQEMPAVAAKVLYVKMIESTTSLSEVAVVDVGYQKVNRSDLTGAIGSVTMDDFRKAPVGTVGEALAGRVAGVQVSSGDGQPGVGYQIIIRGGNSLTQDNTPLYVIDGFPVESPDVNILSPSEIEAIDILKDASATAIYGARGANGVVIITTKRGKIGKPIISYDGSVGLGENLNKFDLMNSYEFVKLQNELSPSYAQTYYLINGKTLDSYKDIPAIDWQNLTFRTAYMQNHTLSVGGGNTDTRYMISGSLLDQQGIIISSGIKRNQAKVVLDQQVNKQFKVGVTANYSNVKAFGVAPSLTQSNSSANFMYSVWAYRPVSGKEGVDLTELGMDPDISATIDSRWNPAITVQKELRNNINNVLSANGYAEYKILPDLTFKSTGGIIYSQKTTEAFNNSSTRSGSSFGTLGVNGSIINNNVNTWLNENTLSYNLKKGKNTFNALGGVTIQGTNYSQRGFFAQKIPNEVLGLDGLDEGVPAKIYSSSSRNTLASFLARANYIYASKYYLTASIRSDGSSKFASGHQWGYFPSASVAWRMKNEPFMKKFSFIYDAKLRMGFGLTGNNRVSDNASSSMLSFPVEADYSFNNQTPQTGVVPSGLANRNLKWETTSQFNIGYDLALFRNKVSLVVDAYRKTTYDLLIRAQLPTTTGMDYAFKNIGRIRNEGLEFALNTTNLQTNKFKWTSSFNISFNRSKVLELNNDNESILSQVGWDANYDQNYLYITKLGQPATQLYGYIWDGNYQLSDFTVTPAGTYVLKNNVADNGNSRSTIKPGDIKLKDINGDRTITANDATAIGRALPIHMGGFTNNFSYKSFDLNVFFQWSYGNDLFNANRIIFEGGGQTGVNQYTSFTNRWSVDNQNNTYFRAGGQGLRGYSYSTRLVEDGSYLRLKTVALGYNFDARLLKSIKVKSARFYLSAQNLITWTNYSGSDPEVSVRNSNNLTPGFDYSAYPRSRTVTIGAQISL